jgi:hypothetical protein
MEKMKNITTNPEQSSVTLKKQKKIKNKKKNKDKYRNEDRNL